MGTRGPLPEPDILKVLRGNPGRRPINLDDGVHPAVAVPDPPDWLNVDARTEWDRLTPELVELGLIGEIDLASIATYCQCWGDLAAMERAWAAQRSALAAKGAVAEAITLHMHVLTTPTGQKRGNPFYERMRELRLDIDRLVRNFGGNASARARVQASDARPPGGGDGDEGGQAAAPAGNVRDFESFRR